MQKKIIKSTTPPDTDSVIKLESIKFSTPAFRRLESIEIHFAPRVTLIAGRNGVGKSTILALITGGSGLTRGVKYKTYFGKLPNANAEEILKLSYEREFVQDDTKKAHVLLTYKLGSSIFHKKGNVSGSEDRLRIVPRNEPKGSLILDGLKIPADGKVPIPTIYLGMSRVLPVGESEPDTLICSSLDMHADDYQLYEEFTNQVISTGATGQTGKVTAQFVKGTKKHSVHPEYGGYDSTTVSLGQDSLSSIATALASFSKLKRTLGTDYKGGLLIIDELDAGFHPHAQIELLEELKSKARELHIQVVATTHSLTMLQHAHTDIYNDKKKGEPLDQIIYLKGGKPLELLDASDFQAIHDDMHMKLNKVHTTPSVKIYVEDDEAALFLEAIFTIVRRKTLVKKTNFNLKIISARVGCSNLVGLLKADDYFKTVVMVLDADTTNVSSGGAANVVRLPADSINSGKQSPEVIIKAMCEKMCADAECYPETRKKLKQVGGSTDYIELNILKRKKGEATSKKSVETDREIAKNWFNLRLDSIKQMKLIEGWVADNNTAVELFMSQIETAILEATGGQSPASKKVLAKPVKKA